MNNILRSIQKKLNLHKLIDHHLKESDLNRFLALHGISDNDPRIKPLKQFTQEQQDLTSLTGNREPARPSDFLQRLAEEHLIIPKFNAFTQEIESIAKNVQSNCNGKVATYIPELSNVDPNQFAVSICTVDGQMYHFGDAQVDFCIQSISKAINYAIALETRGESTVHQHMGREPSGKCFNEINLNAAGLPHNPLINAGGIMCCALIDPESSPSMRIDFIMNYWKQLTGRKCILFDAAVYKSEKLTAHRNYAIAHLMEEVSAFPPNTDLENTLDLYFKCCSIDLNTQDLARSAAVIANGGIDPFSGQSIFSDITIKDCLSVMSFCGMYDFSGEFAFKVGIPSKSGVSGGIMMVVPNLMGIAIWSPKLDGFGNSVRGIEFANQLTQRFNFHNYDNLIGNSPKIDPRRD